MNAQTTPAGPADTASAQAEAAVKMALDALKGRHERQIRQAAERIQEHVGYILDRLDRDSAASIGHYTAGIATDAHEIVSSIAALDGQCEVLGVLSPDKATS